MAKIKSKYSSAIKLAEAWASKDAPNIGHCRQWSFKGEFLYFAGHAVYRKFKGIKKSIALRLPAPVGLRWSFGGNSRHRIAEGIGRVLPILNVDKEDGDVLSANARLPEIILNILLRSQGYAIDDIIVGLDPNGVLWRHFTAPISSNWSVANFNRLAKKCDFNELTLIPDKQFDNFALNFCLIKEEAYIQTRSRLQTDFWNLSGSRRRF